MICARAVFRCFKYLERTADRITGTAGPFFVAMAVCLLSVGTLCFFETVQPTLRFPWITTPVCLLITLNLFAHYYFVCTVPPGFLDDPPRQLGSGIFWAVKRTRSSSSCTNAIGFRASGVKWSEELNVTSASVTKCKQCGQMRPERSHHCRICNRCVLKYDHHCPCTPYSLSLSQVDIHLGINQCVGLHNERHFILFLSYLCISTFCFSLFGFSRMLDALGFSYKPWTNYTPESLFISMFILSVVICFAVFLMGSWHLWGIACAETSVESSDNEHYRKMARIRGGTFVNSYDLGKVKNLELFFNIGGDRYPLYTLIFPFRIPPYTNGRSWARKSGYDSHAGVKAGEELTDSDDDL